MQRRPLGFSQPELDLQRKRTLECFPRKFFGLFDFFLGYIVVGKDLNDCLRDCHDREGCKPSEQ
jgi:hypothetical protein